MADAALMFVGLVHVETLAFIRVVQSSQQFRDTLSKDLCVLCRPESGY